jgi:hypothetical protein
VFCITNYLLTILKLRTTCKKIVASPGNRSRFRKQAKKYYSAQYNDNGTEIAYLMVVRDMKVRWNSTQAMIERSLLLKKVSVFVLICGSTSFTSLNSRRHHTFRHHTQCFVAHLRYYIVVADVVCGVHSHAKLSRAIQDISAIVVVAHNVHTHEQLSRAVQERRHQSRTIK